MPEGPYSFANHSGKRLKVLQKFKKIIQNISARENDYWWQGTQHTPVSAIFCRVTNSLRRSRQTSHFQSCPQRLLLHGAQGSVVGQGCRGDPREDPRGAPKEESAVGPAAVPGSKIASPGTRSPSGRCCTASQRSKCLNSSPSSRRFPAEDEPAAQGSDSWNQEALKPILSLPIYCKLREES